MSYGQQSRNWGGGAFDQFPLGDRLRERDSKLRAAVESYDAEDLLALPILDVVEELVSRVDMEPPVLHWDEAQQLEPTETTIELPSDYGRGRTRAAHATRVTIVVPVSGTTALLGASGSSRLLRTWERSQLSGGELRLWLESVNPTQETLTAWWKREQSEIQRQLAPVINEVAAWRAALPATARDMIERRKARLLRNRGLEGALGIPVRRQSDRPRPVPVQRRMVATTRALRRSHARSFNPEPVLEEQIYSEIIDIVCSFARSLERSPRVAQKYDEEELRDQILVHLNGHFVGEAGGELFNGSGKTDILVRHQDRNVFIAECKFWSGSARFAEAIDQLASYMVWRDTKAALVLFIKQKDASTVVDKAKASIRNHPTHKRAGPGLSASDGCSMFVLRHGDDDEREIQLALIPVIVRPE